MAEITLTAQIQLVLNDDQKEQLRTTRKAYTDACNYVADYIYNHRDLNFYRLNKTLYITLRDRFGVKAQMVQSVLKRVIAAYKTIQAQGNGWIRPSFKKDQYELVWNRDIAIYKGRLMSVNTLHKRIKVPYITKGSEAYFNDHRYRFGTGRLIIKHGKYFIHIPVTYESPDNEPADGTQTIVGIDRGLRFLVTSYDSNGHTAFYSGKEVIQKRRHYSKLRQQLQKRGTRSSKRRLKAISGKEHRYMSDVNHCISKKLVQSYPQGTAFVLEDLSGIRDTTVKVTKKQRYQMCSWSFSDLAQKLEYKAARNGSSVIRIDPHYTSQTCPRCQYVDKSNRNKKLHEFCCKHCGYRSNDDRVGAMNIMNKGMDLLRQGNGYPGDNQVPEQM